MHYRPVFIWLTCFFSLAVYGQDKLQILPRHPQRGQEIIVRYNTAAKDAAISDTATQVQMVFTYSNLFEMPWLLPMKKNGSFWETAITLPPYATYATFYIQSGAVKEQPAPDRHYEIAVFKNGERVENGYLYEGYSLSAQKGRVPGLAAMQAELFEKELTHFPANYEAKLRLLKYRMDTAENPAVKAAFRKKAEGIIADKFSKAPGNMGQLNRVTMGYLIIGENSRLDSIREVVKLQYPNSEAGYELRIGAIMDQPEDADKIAKLEALLRSENPSNAKYLADAHQALMKLYAGLKQEVKALYHLARSGQDTSPYRPETLKRQAEVLTDAGIGLDTAFQLAKEALALADEFPAGLIRYFPETGYLPAYVAPEKRAATTRRAQGNLLSLMALIETKRKRPAQATELVKQALSVSQDVATLANAGMVYKALGQFGNAFASYKNIAQEVPEDTAALRKMKENYRLWKSSLQGWDDQLAELNARWKEDMRARLKEEIISEKAHDYLQGVVDLEGRPVSADAIKNKIVVIDFWATWCVPCMKEMPYVQKAYEKFAGRDDVAFMVVNSGAKNELTDAQGWWGNKRYSFPVYYNKDEQVGEKFGFDFIPAVFIIDKKGFIRFKTVGFEGPSIERKIEAAVEMLSEEG